MDLFSQAEHDELAQSILICPDAAYLDAVEASIRKLLPTMPRQEVITASIGNRAGLILCRDLIEAAEIANFIARNTGTVGRGPERYAALDRHAGAIFMGRNTCEALGDYCAGPTTCCPPRAPRVSPRRWASTISRTLQPDPRLCRGRQTLGEIATALAYGEGLQAHGRSAEYRMGR